MSDLLADLQRTLGGAYRIERELGGGGMSRVFAAEEVALGRKVVLKVLPPELRAGLNIDRFRREIQLAASLHHPNIVPVLAAGEADAGGPRGGLLYYTMPLIEGDSLRTRLARVGELPVGEVVRLLRDVVDALACAHERGVVHRDIKPDNVLLSRQHALVTDFGVAKALSEATGQSSLTSAGVALGTPAYMAPEQATADPHVDHRADIYAVGAMAYEMLAGRPPFIAQTPQAVLAAQVTQAAEPVTRFRPSTPPALAALVMRCLEKRPADRWQSADDLLHQLESMATPSGGLVPTAATPAAPPAPMPAAAPGALRHRAAYLALGLVLALGVAWGISRYRGGGVASNGGQSVAVLPFENLGRPEDAYFADGITEEITNHLTGIGELRVIARSSARAYKGSAKPVKQIGQELGVQYVLEGTVRWERMGDTTGQVRVSPELIRVSDGTSVWAHGYDAAMAGVFQLQSQIAEQVARALDVALAAPDRASIERQPTRSTEAYDYYLRGRAYLARELSEPALRTAEDLFTRAIALDSSFALAWTYLARTHDNLYWFYYDRTEARRERVREAAERAMALQPDLPDAHVSLAYYFYHGFLDYDRALMELDKARRLRPNDSELFAAIGFVKRRQGKFEEAFSSLVEAVKLDPGSIINLEESSWTAIRLNQLDEAGQRMQRARTMAPDDPLPGFTLANLAVIARADTAAARRSIIEALTQSGPRGIAEVMSTGGLTPIYYLTVDRTLRSLLHRPTAGDFGSDSAKYHEWQAIAYQLDGRLPEMRAHADSARIILEARVARQPEDADFHARLGLAYAKLGRKDEAVTEGRRALALRPPSKDAWGGPSYLIAIAEINTLIGNRIAAVGHLRMLLDQRGEVGVNRTTLRYDRRFTALRDDPGFRELVGGGH